MSKIESGMRVVIEFNEAFNRHDVAGMAQLLSDGCVFENADPPPEGKLYLGKELVAEFWQDFFHKSPEAHMKIEELFGYGERCIMRWKCSWVDIDGKSQHLRGADIFRIRDGVIREQLSYVKGET